jgi:hypothetical protein
MGQASCGGRTSRNHVITLQGGHLLCTNQVSDVMSMAQHGLWPRGDRFQVEWLAISSRMRPAKVRRAVTPTLRPSRSGCP